MMNYTVSKDSKSGMWYAHAKGYADIPVAGSFSKKNLKQVNTLKCIICFLTKLNKLNREEERNFLRNMDVFDRQ